MINQPERIDPQFSAEKYTTISDVWSLGITLVELGNGSKNSFFHFVFELFFKKRQKKLKK